MEVCREVSKYGDEVYLHLHPTPKDMAETCHEVMESVIENRWLYVCRFPFLPEMEMVQNDQDVLDKISMKCRKESDPRNMVRKGKPQLQAGAGVRLK